jgi:hypothetical protein
MRILALLVLVVLAIGLFAGAGARASTVQPVGTANGQSSGCQPGGLFGHVAPDGNALVGVVYPDPETGEQCILNDGDTLPGDVLQVWLFTPNAVTNNSVNIGVEEFRQGTRSILVYGPNNTTSSRTVAAELNVTWSNATVPAAAGEFQQFDLQVPPVFADPSNAENLTLQLLGLDLHYMIATPGTALPVAETLGGLIGWLALMSPAAVVAFVGGFGPGAAVVHRLRYVSTGKWAAGFALLVTLVIVIGIASNFTGFLYWLGDVGILGLALLLLLPLFLWGAAFWITVRGKRLKYRFLRSPIAKTKGGEPVAGITAVRIYGGGDTGQPEELVEGLGVGGPGAAFNRLLGLRINWSADKIAREPRLIHYDWSKGSMEVEGEYAAWPVDGGKKLDYVIEHPEKIWFPWRKSVKARFDPFVAPPAAAGGPASPASPEPQRDPALWAHRGFFLGLRHGDASVAALGSPDHVGPDQYIRGVAPAASFGKEAQRRGTALVLLNERIAAEVEEGIHEQMAIHDRLLTFPGSPEAMEGVREISTRVMRDLFDPEKYLQRLEERGRTRVDYRPPGASRWSTSVTDVHAEALEALPPDLRGKGTKKGG